MGSSQAVEQYDQGDHVILSGKACLIYEITSPEDSDTGNTEYEIRAEDVLEGTEITESFPAGTSLEIADVKEEQLEVESIDFDAKTAKLKNGTEASVRSDSTLSELRQAVMDKEMLNQEGRSLLSFQQIYTPRRRADDVQIQSRRWL